MVIKLRDALKQIGVNQDTGELRIKGSSVPAEDDQRINTDSEVIILEHYLNNVSQWHPGHLKVGPSSLEIGPQIHIKDAGNILAYGLNHLSDEYRINPYYIFGESGTVDRLRSVRLIGTPNLVVDLHDGTTNHPAVYNPATEKYELIATNSFVVNFLLWKQAFRCGTTIPTAPVDIKVYVTSEAIENLGTSISLPVSFWAGCSAGDIVDFYFAAEYQGAKTPLAAASGQSYYTIFSSDAPWSLYGDATQAFGRVTGQLYQFDYLMMDNIVELISTGVETLTHDHVINTIYYVDTTLNPVEIKVYTNTLGSFQVNDSDMKFAVNNCTIKIMNADNITVDHTAVLNFPNGSYDFIYNKDDSTWYYSEVGKGKWVAISSDHTASTDFPYEPQLPDITCDACEEHAGMVKYRTDSNNSYLDMCMKTGSTTYAWVNIKTNNW